MSPDSYVLLGRDLVGRSDAAVSAFDRGFLYGDGFFETTRVMDGVALFLDRHLDRLVRSCKEAGFQYQPDAAVLAEDLRDLIAANSLADGYMRLTVTRGRHDGSLTQASGPLTVFAEARAADLPPLDATPPITVAISPYRLNEDSALAGHKSISYQANLLALAEARTSGADDALFLNSNDDLCECTISNLFLVVDGHVLTPAESCGPLPGITRAAVLGLCAGLGLRAEEGRYEVEDLQAAAEVFCTNSLRGIMPVAEVVGICIALPAPGPVTTALQTAYAAEAARWCRQHG
jgi:branched-subunit amino acid aminotransferase/4-amino-4-deoxychorismate lyase